MTDARGLYLDLMKRCLTNFIYQDARYEPPEPDEEQADTVAFDPYRCSGPRLADHGPYDGRLETAA